MNNRLLSLMLLLLFLTSLVCLSSLVSEAYGQKRGQAQQKSGSSAAGLVEEADKLAEDRKWPEAIAAYQRAIQLDANYAPAYGGLGDAYLDSGKWKQALEAYQEQVRLAPKDAQAQYDLGYAYNIMGRHGEAFVPLVKAISLDPKFAEAYYGIGYAYLRGSDFEKSISFFKSAVRLQPDYADAYYGLGEAYARLGKADAASEQAKKLATIDQVLARNLEKTITRTLATATDNASIQAPRTTQKQDKLADSEKTTTQTLPPGEITSVGSTIRPRRATPRQADLISASPEPNVESQPVVNKAIYSDIRFGFDTLDGVTVNASNGNLILFGHSSGSRPLRSIPYLDYLAAALESDNPTFSLEWTPESSRAIDRAFDIADRELVNRLTGTFDSGGHVTKRGEWWYRMLGANVHEGMDKMSFWMAVFPAAGYPNAGEVIKAVDEVERAAGAGTGNKRTRDPDGFERSPLEHLINATAGVVAPMDQNFMQTYANAMNGDVEAKKTLFSRVLRGIARAYKLDDNRYTDRYESGMRGGEDYGTAIAKALELSQDDTIQVQKNAFEALVGNRTMIHVTAEVMREVLGVTPVVVPVCSGLPSHSLLAKVAFDADIFGKSLMEMPEIKSDIPGYRTYFEWRQTVDRAPAAEGHTWFAPAGFELFESADGGRVRFGKTPIRIHMERYDRGTGSSERKSVEDPLLKQYADELTALYEPLATKFPVLLDLRESMKVMAIADWLKQKGIKLVLPTEGRGSWNPPAQYAGVIHMEIAVKEASVGSVMSASGGIDFRVDRNWNLVKDAIASQPGPPAAAHVVTVKFDPGSGVVTSASAATRNGDVTGGPPIDINKPVDPGALVTDEYCKFAARKMTELRTLEAKLMAKQSELVKWRGDLLAEKRGFDKLHAEAVHGEMAEVIEIIPTEAIFKHLLDARMISSEAAKRLERTFKQLQDAGEAVTNAAEARNEKELIKVQVEATQDAISDLIEISKDLPLDSAERLWDLRTVKVLKMFGATAKAMLGTLPATEAKWWDRYEPAADLILDLIAIANPEFAAGIGVLRIGERQLQKIVVNRARDSLGGAIADNWNAGIYLSQKLLRVKSDLAETQRTITQCNRRTEPN